MSWSAGDWMCGVCDHRNFKKREACQKCWYPKSGNPDPAAYGCLKTEALPGDWFCGCGGHNYAGRSSCYRCNAFKNRCGSDRDSGGSGGGALPGWKSGDWVCRRIGCEVHNYASRIECFKCKAPRDSGGAI